LILAAPSRFIYDTIQGLISRLTAREDSQAEPLSPFRPPFLCFFLAHLAFFSPLHAFRMSVEGSPSERGCYQSAAAFTSSAGLALGEYYAHTFLVAFAISGKRANRHQCFAVYFLSPCVEFAKSLRPYLRRWNTKLLGTS
jgi:hypothetical protein